MNKKKSQNFNIIVFNREKNTYVPCESEEFILYLAKFSVNRRNITENFPLKPWLREHVYSYRSYAENQIKIIETRCLKSYF